MWLRKHLNSSHLTVENLIAKEYSPLAAAARKHYQAAKVGLARGPLSQGPPPPCPSASPCPLGSVRGVAGGNEAQADVTGGRGGAPRRGARAAAHRDVVLERKRPSSPSLRKINFPGRWRQAYFQEKEAFPGFVEFCGERESEGSLLGFLRLIPSIFQTTPSASTGVVWGVVCAGSRGGG